jgi:glycosyltransferase involved in cell wall biosynthesis
VPSKTYGVMAAGRPLLAFLDPHSEIGRVIDETGCGIVLPEPDGPAIAQTIRELMGDEARLRRMGQNARNAFLTTYTLSHAVDRYQQLLQETFYCYNQKHHQRHNHKHSQGHIKHSYQKQNQSQ